MPSPSIIRSFELPGGPISSGEHYELARTYWEAFGALLKEHRAADEQEIQLFLRTLNRSICECMLYDERLPAASILSPAQSYSSTGADGRADRQDKPTRRMSSRNVDLATGDAVYVLDLTGRLLVSSTSK